MPPGEGGSLVGGSWGGAGHCFLSEDFSACGKVPAGIRPKRNMRNKDQAMGVDMLPQTEDKNRISEQTVPFNDLEVGKRPHKLWLVLTIVLIAVATVFI